MNIKKTSMLGASLVMFITLLATVPALAAININGAVDVDSRQGSDNGVRSGAMLNANVRMGNGADRGQGMMRFAVMGKVTAVSGNTITVNGRTGFGSTTTEGTYSVNATNATIKKNNVVSTMSAIMVGDMIVVEGTVNGTNVVATTIMDGAPGRMMDKGDNKNGQGMGMWNSTSSPIIGNGQPVVAGTVTAVSGTTLTVTTASNVTYTVDAANAKAYDGQNTSTLSNVAVGNKVVIQGTVNGTSVTASTVVTEGSSNATSTKQQSKGFFSSIGRFFIHIFGF